MKPFEYEHFVCQCSDFGHDIRFVFDPEDGDLWIDVHMHAFDPWYKRIWTSIKYVFNKERQYGDYDTTMLKVEDFPRLRNLLDRAEEAEKGRLKTVEDFRNNQK